MSTRLARFQTDHQSQPFAMAVYEARRGAARLTSGGVLTWDSTTGTFTWTYDIIVEFPTLAANVIIPAGSETGITVGQSLYFALPYLQADDVSPTGAWNLSLGDYTLTAPEILIGAPAPENEQLFIVATHGVDGQLYCRHHLVLTDGVPSGFGNGGLGSSRYIVTSDGTAGQVSDMGFDYLPDRRHIDVYLNGQLLTPGVSGGGTGYRDSDISGEADYYEIQGAGTLPWYRGIYIQKTVASGEEIIIILNVGGQGPQGPPGPLGGLDDSYNAGNEIDIHDLGSDLRPIVLNEGTPGAKITGSPLELDSYRVPLLQCQRTPDHPNSNYRDKTALALMASGDVGAGGLFLYNLKNYSTLDNELDGTGIAPADGVYFIGQGFGSGSAIPEEKLVVSFARRSDIDAGKREAQYLPQIRQDESFAPHMDTGVFYGQLAVNEHGEIATGWGRDFLRWHTMTFTLPSFPVGETGDSLALDPIPLNTDVVEPTAEFLGGICAAPHRDDVNKEVFFHVNPSNVYAGDNPFEIELAMTKVGGEWNILITYGRDMETTTIKVTIFFSAEYAVGASAPDEGDFSDLTSYLP
jgi:hypothetical protein